jgi:anti-sigma B factor antagonist
MAIDIRDVADGVIDVALKYRLDTPGVERLESRLLAEVTAHDSHAIVDLSKVDFVGSMAIRMFVSLTRAMQRRGHRLVLYGAQPPVQATFDTVALHSLVPVAPDGPAALALARG